MLALGCDTPAEPAEHAIAEQHAPVQFRCATEGGAFIIGLEEVTLCGNVEVLGGVGLDIFSNELIHLSGSYSLMGNAVVAQGGAFEVSGNGNGLQGELISGALPLVAEPAVAAAAAAESNNNNANLVALKNGSPINPIVDGKLKLSGKTQLIAPAGDYYFENGISVSGQATITVQGPVRFFVNGAVKISGTTETAGEGGTLEVISVSSQTVTLAGTAEARMHISAPLAQVKVAGTFDFFGSILGRVVSLTGTATIRGGGDASNYDAATCEPPSGDDGGGDDGDDGDEPPPWDDGGNPWDPDPDPETPTDPL